MAGEIKWENDYQAALTRARAEGKLVFLDFYNPGWIGCQQMGAVTYSHETVAKLLNREVVAIQLPFDVEPYASEFRVKWTPALFVIDEEGVEHHSTVGFLPPEEFIPFVKLGLAKAHYNLDHLPEALIGLETVIDDYPGSMAAPEAIYLRGVTKYKITHTADGLIEAYDKLSAQYPASEWTRRAEPYRLLKTAA